MARLWMAASLAALGLAGCAIGSVSDGGSLSGSFEVAQDYRQAFLAARKQAERCLVGDGGYEVRAERNDAAGTGLIRVVPRLVEGQVARIEVVPQGADRTRVDVSMWGRSIWNADAMRAMHDAVVFGVPSCTTYMPGKSKDADWFHTR